MSSPQTPVSFGSPERIVTFTMPPELEALSCTPMAPALPRPVSTVRFSTRLWNRCSGGGPVQTIALGFLASV